MLKLGTAKITIQTNAVILDYVRTTSFLEGRQVFTTQEQAERFCRDNGIRVVR